MVCIGILRPIFIFHKIKNLVDKEQKMFYSLCMREILYESGRAAQIIEVPERTLRYWATIKAISPEKDSIGIPGIRRCYSFINLVEGAILRELKKQGITISLGEKAVAKVREKNFGKLKKGSVCFLKIAGGKRIDVLIMEDLKLNIKLTDISTEIDPFFKLVEILSDALKRLDKKGIQEWFEKNQEKSNELIDKGSLISFYSRLGKWIIEPESIVIIPVHSLREEIEKKLKI
jgi:DNA-binding transcriptional MerR regulator